MTDTKSGLASRGFTLVELIAVVVVLAAIAWLVMHFLVGNGAESKGHPATQGSTVPSESEAPRQQQGGKSDGNRVEASTKTAIKIALIGLIWVSALGWQSYVIVGDQENGLGERMVPAAWAAGVLLVGVIAVSVFEILDGRRALPIDEALGNVGRATTLSLFLVLKSYLGPLTVALALSSVVYFFFTYGELRTIPLIQGVFDWAFAGPPRWLSWSYTAVVSLYSLGAAIHDTDLSL